MQPWYHIFLRPAPRNVVLILALTLETYRMKRQLAFRKNLRYRTECVYLKWVCRSLLEVQLEIIILMPLRM